MIKRPKSLDSIAASIQPLEASTTGHFDNKQPSKGFIISLVEFPRFWIENKERV